MPDKLAAQAKVLADRVSALSAGVAQLDRRSSRSEKVVIIAVVGLVLDLILSIIVAFVLVSLDHNNDTVAAAIEREQHTREDSLCPLYGLILGSYNPQSRPEGEARDLYNQQFDVMRQAHKALECTAPIVPPATRPAPPTTGGPR